MATEVRLPRWSMGMDAGTVVTWYKSVGDVVAEGEALVSIEAEKTTDDILAPVGGTLLKLLVDVGETVPALTVVAVIGAPEEVDHSTGASTGPAGSPAIRVEASEQGDGCADGARSDQAGVGEFKTIPLSGTRGTIARRMHASLQTMAQFTLVREADVTSLVDHHAARRAESGFTLTDFIVMATIRSLVAHPRLNARLVDDKIIVSTGVNLGIAIALDDGLIVPVLRDAQSKSMRDLHLELHDLAARSRDGTVAPDEVTEGTFTITNLGTYGIDAFTPIINSPEVAILGIGQVREDIARDGEQFTWRKRLSLSLTIDHRAIDGAPGARFLQTLAEELGKPAQLEG